MKRGIGRANGRRRPGPDHRGMVLAMALLVMVALGLAGSAILALSLTESKVGKNDVEGTQALYLAEAGIQAALNSLSTGGTGVFTNTPLGPAGAYTTTVTAFDPPAGQKKIVATGTVPPTGTARAVRKIAVLATSSSSSPVNFPYAMQAAGTAAFSNISMVAGSSFDSYDSANGAYEAACALCPGGTNKGSEANVRTNSGAISNASATIKGNATAGGAIYTVTNPGGVTGTVTNGAAAVSVPNVTCPAATYGTLNVPSNTTYNMPAGTYYYNSFQLGGTVVGGTVEFTVGGPVLIYIQGPPPGGSQNFSIADNTYVNVPLVGGVRVPGLPANLIIIGCGSDSSNWTAGTGPKSFAIYAPTHYITINFSSNGVFGAIVEKYGILGGTGGQVHYDKALGRLGGGTPKFTAVPRSWTELSSGPQ